ncbi:MAG: hypothetical protein AAF513_15270 [Pseudomonadota bacterium]
MRTLLATLVMFCASIGTHAQELQIFDLDDIVFGETPTNSVGASQSMEFCVRMRPPGPFIMTAYGTSQNGGFALTSGAPSAYPIGFEVTVADTRFRSQTLLPGIPSTTMRARPLRRNARPCRQPLRIDINIDEAALRGAPPGNYRGVLQLTVTPE